MLSDSDGEPGDLHTLTINDHYTKASQYRKEREELAKLEEKYGPDASDMSNEEDSEDSEDTSEDSDGAELTPAVDAAILRTLARIRKKDPEIYDGDRQVFEEEQTRTKDRAPLVKTKTKDKSKPLTIRQAALSAALNEHTSSRSPSPQPLTHLEEQGLLQSETRAAFHGAIDSLNNGNEDDEDDLLVPRSRTRDEVELEEEEYKTFLEREVGEELRQLVIVDIDGGVDSAPAYSTGKDERKKKKAAKVAETSERKGQTRPKEDEDHEFLINYIFNRGWIDRTKQRIPTYDEIVDSSKTSRRKKSKLRDHDGSDSEERNNRMEEREHGPTLSDEEEFDDLVDAFETSYNFRFEEPEGALIASHPRNIASVRRESTTRKEARERKKERKEAEKRDLLVVRKEEIRRERKAIQQRVSRLREGDELTGDDHEESSRKEEENAEVARLRDLKAKELGRKLERVTAEGGLSAISQEALANLDFDSPWDPDKHDAQMAALYDVNIDLGDLEKPGWDDDINVDDIVPSQSKPPKEELKKLKKKDKKKRKKEEDRWEEDGVAVDAMDVDAEDGGWEEDEDEDEEWDGTEEMRKRKVEKYMDEVANRLGFNDITAHMPTRFHYIQTAPEDCGLTPAEILLATDAELNAYAGLKKIAPYRNSGKSGKGKSWDPKRNERLQEFREKLRLRLGDGEGDWTIGGVSNRRRAGGSEGSGEKKKRLGKKERAKMKASAGEDVGEAAQMDQILSKKRKLESPPTKDQDVEVPTTVEGTSRENGAPRKKRRRQHKEGGKRGLI